MNNTPALESIIEQIEIYANQNNIDHRFVGGVSFGGLLNEKTTCKIDLNKKTIYLKRHNTISLERSDHTIRDIDLISFCDDAGKIKGLKKFIKKLKKHSKRPFPDVSIEAAIHTKFKNRKYLFQFVTAYEIIGNRLYLAFDEILQNISWKSVEPWYVVLETGLTYTVRNPIADYYAYYFRSPAGIKPKDEKKIVFVKKLADALISEGKKHKPRPIDYLSGAYYGHWKDYIEQLHSTKNTFTKSKIILMRLYWQTIGNILGHSQLLAGFSTQFTGVRQ